MNDKSPSENESSAIPQRQSRGKLAARFRRMNILLFTAAFCVMAALMAVLLNGVVERVSSEYAGQYALSSSEALSSHISWEIDTMKRIANSRAVAEWLADEYDSDKMERALRDMTAYVNELYSFNLYIVFESSLNQYTIERNYEAGDAQLVDVAVLSESEPDDFWYFDVMTSDSEYSLDIAMDKLINRKRVWLNYPVVSDGKTLGVLSTGMEFSHVVGELFSQYERGNIRGLIVDEYGIIHMDSYLMQDRDFLFGDFAARIDEVFTHAGVLAAIESSLAVSDSQQNYLSGRTVIRVPSGPYSHVTAAQIRSTTWSVLILTGGTSILDTPYFIPIMVAALVLLLIVALITSAANYRLIFLPLGKLNRSLATLRESVEGQVSGTERDDELGELSRTIQDLFSKANIDALTGIYNRRFMENNLEHVFGILARENGSLSVLMIDIDFFKKYNDTYGHDQGDVCLRSVAQAISISITRASDFVARYGGEEFIAILPNTDANGAIILAEKLLESVRALGIPHSGNPVTPYVTVSIGVTSGAVVYGSTWEEFVKRADDALYSSKQNGRNQYTFSELNREVC